MCHPERSVRRRRRCTRSRRAEFRDRCENAFAAVTRAYAISLATVAQVLASVALTGAHALAQSTPAPAPSYGPCEQSGAIGAIVDRPGIGRPTANNGSPCVVPWGHLLVESGYRNQQTSGADGTSVLVVYPLALLRVGVGGRWEVALQPPAQAIRSGASLGGTFDPAVGSEDAGLGIKRMLDDRATFQDAVEFFATSPTGAPTGSVGFSTGGATYTLSYTAAFPLSSIFGASVTQNFTQNEAALGAAPAPSFFSYQPSLTLSYGFPKNFTLLVADQFTTPLTATGGTGNRALLGLQRVLSPGVVVDAEFELNTAPMAPAQRQHAYGFGAAFQL